MLGLTEPSAGTATVCEINSTINPTDVKRKVGYLPEDVGFYSDLSGLDNLKFIARLNELSEPEAEERALKLLERVGLLEQASKKAGKYSRGMRQRLGLAEVLIKNPKVIILDEPTSGIDPTGVRDFLQLIVQLSHEEGLTVLFSSHNLYQVQQVCDRVGIFVRGKLLAQGNIQDLAKQLFSNEPFSIQAGTDNSTNPDLIAQLEALESVNSVREEKTHLQIGSTTDITADVARIIVHSGGNLSYLHKKEYGLDDIYNRYFEGGAQHE